MAYSEALAERVRDALDDRADVREQKMFGGLAFMVSGNMCCGIMGDDLLVRVGKDGYDDAMARPHTREMDFTGRPMRGFVVVDAEGVTADPDLDAWVERARAFVDTLPAK